MFDLDQSRQLLLMAAAVHNLGPELGSRDRFGANAFKVVRQALHWAGLYEGEVRAAFERYEESPEVTAFYDALVSMMPQGNAVEPLFEGEGNLCGKPRASPFFTHCRLTDRGWVAANQLLQLHPTYRQNLWQSG